MGEVIKLKNSLDDALSTLGERIRSGEIKTALVVYVDNRDDMGIMGLSIPEDLHHRYMTGLLDDAKALLREYLAGEYEVEEA